LNTGYGFYDNQMDIRARFQERRSSNCPCFCFIQFMLVLLTWPHHVATLLQQSISFCPQESIGKVRSWRTAPTTHYQCRTFESGTEKVKREITTKCCNTNPRTLLANCSLYKHDHHMHNANPSSLLISIALLSPCCVASSRSPRPVQFCNGPRFGSWAGLYSTPLFYFYIWAWSVGGENPAQTCALCASEYDILTANYDVK